MTLKEFKNALEQTAEKPVQFKLPNGNLVPEHFHVTEVGQIQKRFIDCGGTLRKEQKVNFQLWESTDTWHRLPSEKLLNIIALSEAQLGLEDGEIEVEYQGTTIEKYGVRFEEGAFVLHSLATDCLAKDNCGISSEKPKLKLAELKNSKSCCSPEGGCC